MRGDIKPKLWKKERAKPLERDHPLVVKMIRFAANKAAHGYTLDKDHDKKA